MGAKDTVKFKCTCGQADIEELSHSHTCRAYNKGKVIQAEISFKAGIEFAETAIQNQLLEVVEASKKVGIREVVEWITEHHPYLSFLYTDEWQDQLKAWGVKVDHEG